MTSWLAFTYGIVMPLVIIGVYTALLLGPAYIRWMQSRHDQSKTEHDDDYPDGGLAA